MTSAADATDSSSLHLTQAPHPAAPISTPFSLVFCQRQSAAAISRAYHPPLRAISSRPAQPFALVPADRTILAPAHRLKSICGGGVGLIAVKMTRVAAPSSMKVVNRMLTAIIRHIAAVLAAATPEGLFEDGRRLFDAQHYADAAQRLSQAVDMCHPQAHALLSNLLIDGRPGVPKDHDRAFRLASAGARMCCPHSKGVLGRCWGGGYGTSVDHAVAYELGRESAAAGSFYGQCVVGVCCSFGQGAVMDAEEAVRYFNLSAQQGYSQALYNLGVMHRKGEGVPRDDAEAARLFSIVSAQGHACAQFNLGVMFDKGDGVEQDKAEAMRLYRLAADQGFAFAQFNLGIMCVCPSPTVTFSNLFPRMCKYGDGVQQDLVEATRWFRLSAAQGHEKSERQLQALNA